MLTADWCEVATLANKKEQKQKVRKVSAARAPAQTSFEAPISLQCLNTTKISLTVLGVMAGLWTTCERY
ncbi:hypothetical protein AOLI_G00048090 [Acnodon oligacanthus]